LTDLGITMVTIAGGNKFSGSTTKGEVGNMTNAARTHLLACLCTSMPWKSDGVKHVGSNTIL